MVPSERRTAILWAAIPKHGRSASRIPVYDPINWAPIQAGGGYVQICREAGLGLLHRMMNCVAMCVEPSIPLDKKTLRPDRDRMIRVSAAQYFWFSYPTSVAEQGTRAI